jgi:Sigma-70 region 2
MIRRKSKRHHTTVARYLTVAVVFANVLLDTTLTTAYTTGIPRWQASSNHNSYPRVSTFDSKLNHRLDHTNRIIAIRHETRLPSRQHARQSNVEELYAVAPRQQQQQQQQLRSDDWTTTTTTPTTTTTGNVQHRNRRVPIKILDETAGTDAISDLETSTTDLQASRKRIKPHMTLNVLHPNSIQQQQERRSNTLSTTKPKLQSSKSRSSTMPGFLNENTAKQRVFRDSVRFVEERTGRKYVDTPEQKQRRRKMNGELMYKNSPSVPDSLVQFASEIHQEERITRREEIELGEKTQEAIRIQHLFQSLEDRLGREPTDDEWCAAAGKINMAAIGQAIEDGIEAKNKLVTSNLRMVQSVVNTYIRNGLSAQYNAGDLMQEGILALIRAAEKFEPDRGWKFSTYAMYW